MNVHRRNKKRLSLINDGQLSIIPLGCGGAFSKVLYQNNFLVVKGDRHVMIDCGTRAPQALHERGVKVTDIQTWLITHSHADHIGGLEEVMLMGRYFAGKKPDILITEEYQSTLWNRSLSGANAFNEIKDGGELGFDDYWNPIRPEPLPDFSRDTREFRVGELSLKIVRTRHYPQQATGWADAAYSVGVILDDRVLFTGDTLFDVDFLTTYDVQFRFESVFHDVQFFTGGVHAGIDELATLPAAMKSKILLMHYGDTWKAQQKRVRDDGFGGFVRQGLTYDFI